MVRPYDGDFHDMEEYVPRRVRLDLLLEDEEVELIARDTDSDPDNIGAETMEVWLFDTIQREFDSRITEKDSHHAE